MTHASSGKTPVGLKPAGTPERRWNQVGPKTVGIRVAGHEEIIVEIVGSMSQQALQTDRPRQVTTMQLTRIMQEERIYIMVKMIPENRTGTAVLAPGVRIKVPDMVDTGDTRGVIQASKVGMEAIV
jgi:hypothetical protein